MPETPGPLIRKLRDEARTFAPSARRSKQQLIRRISRLPRLSASHIHDYHEALLYMAAHPDDREMLLRVERELRRIGAMIRQSRTGRGASLASRLEDSGIDGTTAVVSLSLHALAFVASRFGRDVAFAWEDESLGNKFDELLELLVHPVEADGLRDDSVSTQEWVAGACGAHRLLAGPTLGSRLRGNDGGSRAAGAAQKHRLLAGATLEAGAQEISWLIDRIVAKTNSPALREALLARADPRVRWQLSMPAASRTLQRFPARRLFAQAGPLLRAVDTREILAQPLPAPRKLSPRDVNRLIDVSMATLCVRGRETDPVTYHNRRELDLFSLDRGIDVALFGMAADWRLPIESYFGFVAARNRVPIAYGGAWIFFDRAAIGVNIFDTFRGGESAFLFAQIMRVYRQRFGARAFTVDPYQFGAGNPEGIQSGAYWFYYRLGFRSKDAAQARMAQLQWKRIQHDPQYRSSTTTLRRLAGSPLVLQVDPARTAREAPNLTRLGWCATRWIGSTFAGDGERAQRTAVALACRRLGIDDFDQWRSPRRTSLESLAPLIVQIPDLAAWPSKDKRSLIAALSSKFGPRERSYSRALSRCDRLREAWIELAGTE